MTARELIVLSPYRLPTKNTLMLGNDDVGGLLNGYTALWHPAAARGASGPPKIASPYDYESPTAGHIYAVPESPPLVLPDDWDQRVIEAGAVAFRSSADRELTIANLMEAIKKLEGPDAKSLAAERCADRVAPFFGIGFGFAHVEALFEAMEHENLLAVADLWHDVQQAIEALAAPDPDQYRQHLQAAADRLLQAREILYPVNLHLLDIGVLEEVQGLKGLPASLAAGLPLNLVASAALLEKLAKEQPEAFADLRERVAAEQVELCGGPYLDREDHLLPVESQIWNLLQGLSVCRELFGRDVRVYGRKKLAMYPPLPMLLSGVGLHRALLVTFDESSLPSFRSTVVNWSAADGKQVETFARTPYKADDPQTFFHVAHYLQQTIAQDHAATLALVHRSAPAAPWYHDWLELSRFGPVLGRWTTLSQYLNDVTAGEYASASSTDEFHADYLSPRTEGRVPHPTAWFARHLRQRRRLDSAMTLAAMHQGLGGNIPGIVERLGQVEKQLECGSELGQELAERQQEAAEALAQRLVSRATALSPGFMVLNPCSFTRRLALEVDGVHSPLPIEGPIKACQLDADKARLVVEVPPLGFAWFPRSGPPGTPAQKPRLRMADDRHVRNEFFEAEIDPHTGGLRGVWDQRTRISRIGQQLVFNPGSNMRASSVKATINGAALGEVVSEGALLDEQEQVLARFRQRFRAWLGRPLLEIRIEIFPEQPPTGYAWHAYYGARFAWRDERSLLLRGVNGTAYVSNHTRPDSPDFLELRQGRQNTVLFPGGLPFHQRHGARMLDVILVPEGETAQVFDLALGLDREHPMQTALGLATPAVIVPTAQGPPHVGATGWLFHLDAPNLLLTGMRPAADGADAVVGRMAECSAFGGHAEFRCPRDPRLAVLLDARGEVQIEAGTSGDAASFEAAQGDLLQLRLEFS